MKTENKEVKRRKNKPRAEKVPDYDYLFQQSPSKKAHKKNPFFRKLIKLNFFSLLLSTIVLVFQNAPEWAIPICSSNIIDLVTAAVGSGSMSGVTQGLLLNAIVLGILILLNVPMTVWRWRIVSKMLRRTSAGIKCSVVRKLQGLSITYHKDMQTGKIQSKFLKDTDAVDNLFHMLMFALIPNILNVIVSVSISLYSNLYVSLFFLLIIPCNVGLTVFFRKRIRKRYRDYRLNTETMSVRLTTMLEMLPVTKAHGLEAKEIKTVEHSISELANSGKKMDNTTAFFGSSTYVGNKILAALCLVFCSILAIKKVIGVGEIILYQSMFTTISGSISGLISILPSLSSGFEALFSVSEIMEATAMELNVGKKHPPALEGNVEFENVYYKYPNTEEYVVENLDLKVKAGECIAVVGSSGSGKSTLMNLIIGLLMPTEGDIRIDGSSIQEINLSEYRQHLSVVPQSSILFSGSIRDNITYGLDRYTEEDLNTVVEMANLNEFVKDLPNGLNTEVGEHGDKLSGGQKQRVTIARALIRNPKILILDEATSALDNVSEFQVQQAIAKSIRGRTTFIVAHRLSTIRDADRIVVMENGKAVEIGTYDELMEKQGRFYELKHLSDMNIKTAEEGLQ